VTDLGEGVVSDDDDNDDGDSLWNRWKKHMERIWANWKAGKEKQKPDSDA
jgi:hypothetical protein